MIIIKIVLEILIYFPLMRTLQQTVHTMKGIENRNTIVRAFFLSPALYVRLWYKIRRQLTHCISNFFPFFHLHEALGIEGKREFLETNRCFQSIWIHIMMFYWKIKKLQISTSRNVITMNVLQHKYQKFW